MRGIPTLVQPVPGWRAQGRTEHRLGTSGLSELLGGQPREVSRNHLCQSADGRGWVEVGKGGKSGTTVIA